MDREALVRRNQKMAEAFHQMPLKHYIRRGLIHALSYVPVMPQQESEQRILLIRPDHLGDVLLATPAVRALREALPDVEIHALVGNWSAGIMGNIDAVDLVLTLPFPGFNRGEQKKTPLEPYSRLFKSASHLRQIGYSSALIMRPDHWWGAALAYFAGIPERIGYNLTDVTPFLTHALDYKLEHAVRQNLRLVENWTGHLEAEQAPLHFPVYEGDTGYVDDYLGNWGIAPEERIIAIHPGSGTWAKLWEEEKWASVADTLSEQINARVVFTGGPGERSIVQRIAANMRHRPCIMVGDTRLEQLAALYRRARVVLGPDSGPMHLAVAVGTPTVTLFGPADPIEFGPWGPPEKHKVLTTDIGCRPCRVLDWADDNPEYHPCVRDITIGQVLAAARHVAKR